MRPSNRRLASLFRSNLVQRAVLPAILALALVLRLIRLGQANLWWDEALAIWAVRKGLVGVTLWTAGDVHPPLYFWSLWTWVQLFGESPFAMRSLSALMGVLTVAVVYALGKLAGGQHVGRLAALLMACARFHIWWSQEMRMYVLAGLCCALSLYAFLRWLHALEESPGASLRARTPHRWLGLWALATTAAMYTIFLSGAILLVENLVALIAWLWRRGDRRILAIPWIVAQMGVGLLVGVWLLVSWGRMPTWSVAEPLRLRAFLDLYIVLSSTGISVDIGRYTLLAWLPWAIAAAGAVPLIARWRPQIRANRPAILTWLTLWLTVSLTGAAIYSATLPRGLFYTPRIEARYFMPFAFAFWVLLAWALVSLWERWRLVGGACLTLVLAIWLSVLPGYYQGRHLQDTAQSLVRAILSQAHPGDGVLLDSGSRYPIFLYDYERLAPESWRPPMRTLSLSEDDLTAAQVQQAMPRLADEFDRLWLVELDVNLSDPQRLVAGWLETNLKRTQSLTFGHNALYLYGRQEATPTLARAYQPQHPLVQDVGKGRLLGWDLPVDTVIPGDVLHVALLWERTPDTPIAITLVNANGQSVARHRAAGTTARQQFDIPIDETLPNGDYVLHVELPDVSSLPLGKICITQASRWPQAGILQVQQPARFGPAITLQGYTLHMPSGAQVKGLRAGHSLALDLYWAADGEPAADYTVFVHLLGQAYNPRTQGPLWAGHDSPPAAGNAPTLTWMAGDTVVDRHVLTVDAQAPLGEYQIEVGLYDAATGQRLGLIGPQGELLGDHFVLESPLRIIQ